MNEQEIYEQNEIKANKAMTFTSLVVGVVLLILFVLTICGINPFSFTDHTIRYIEFAFPIDIILLISPVFYLKTNLIKKPTFKYFLLTVFVAAIALINLILPKDGVMMWALCIAVAAMYFNPKVTKYVFILTSIMMVIVTPLSMFYGSWESNMLYVSESEFGLLHYIGEPNHFFDSNSIEDKFYWVNNFKEICEDQLPGVTSINRWVSCFVFYFLPRFLTLIVISQLANGLAKRTKLIQSQQISEAKSIQKMSSELNIAAAIQSSVLPSEFPDSSRCELFAMMDPAKEIGGDFYDFFKIDDDHVALVIGDVSGKGVPASLFMMKTQSIVKALSVTIKDDPAKIFTEVNKALCEGNDMNMFVTCWLGILDLNKGTLNFSSAGHNPPVIKKHGKYEYLVSKNGLVLGGFDGAKYVNNSIKLEKGDKLLLYTDGVTEAHNKKEELYSEPRLLKFLTKIDTNPVDSIMKIREDIKEFADGAEQFDDITMLMIEYHKPQSVFAKKFYADKDNLPKVQDFILSSIKGIELTQKDKNQLLIAIEEIFINIASYSFEDYGRVDVGVNSQDGTLTLIFMDNGKPFNPLAKEDPNIDAKAQDREIGGLGIYMVKNLMDKVYYDYKDGRNMLTLIKKY